MEVLVFSECNTCVWHAHAFKQACTCTLYLIDFEAIIYSPMLLSYRYMYHKKKRTFCFGA